MSLEPSNRPRRFRSALLLGRVLVLVAVATVILGPIIGIRRAFEQVEAMKSPTPSDLQAGVRNALWAIPVGAAIGLVGAALIVFARVSQSRLDKRDPFAPPPERPV